jgi:hypothetical protein
LDGPRTCGRLDTLPLEYRIARASDTTGSSMGLSTGVGNWLFSYRFGVVGSICTHSGWGGVEGRTSSMGMDVSFAIPRPTAPTASRREVAGMPPISAAAAFSLSALLSSRRLSLSWSALAFLSFRLLSLSRISRSAPASSVSARSSILLDLFFSFSSCLLRGPRSLGESRRASNVAGEVRSGE